MKQRVKQKRVRKSQHPPRPQRAEQAAPQPLLPETDPSFPIVGIGASAGGLEAFTQLLQHLPAEPGMALVLVQHLDPKHESMLTELLSRVSKIPVRQASEGLMPEPNNVYVIPPDKSMTIVRRALKLVPRTQTRGQHMPIDYFFRSLAQDQGNKAIGVILSGTASDGALGLEAIKGEGGVTFAQDDKTAKFGAMPRSAIATGSVDFILPPDRIAEELVRLGRHPYVAQPHPIAADESAPAGQDDLGGVLSMLRSSSGVDFTCYKRSTIRRRVMRRMTLHKIERLLDYAKFLREHPDEVDALYYDILIKVTRFFRDPEAFEALKTAVFPLLMKHRASRRPIRIWVPGCATGEEVYSIAISLLEFLGDGASANMQIFATDVNESALNKARAGVYIENIALDVSPERLRRFFVKVNGSYQIVKSIRESCVFARQNVFKDPPFSNLDLISCRNVLIYLGPALQNNVIPVFHYALKPTGFLMLGASETVGVFPELFQLVDRKNKIYAKKLTSTRFTLGFSKDYLAEEHGRVVADPDATERPWKEIDLQKEADRVVLNQYAAPGVLINDNMEVLQFRGDPSLYLRLAPGKASFDLIRMAREGLVTELRAAIEEARRSQAAVSREGATVKVDGETRLVTLRVIPVHSPVTSSTYYVVLFDERRKQPATAKKERPVKIKLIPESRQVRQLKQELSVTKQHLQSIIEGYEAANEELKSANEEILSTNEELQSTNEELETAKEELQSTNEELTTVNEEVQSRNTELAQVNNDFTNVLGSINLPIVVLGTDLRIRVCTPMAEKVLKLIPGDIGRPIRDLNLNITVPNLEGSLKDVVDSVTTKELEAQDHDGRWYSIRMRPYRTDDNKIAGAVLVFVDIDSLKRSGSQQFLPPATAPPCKL